MRRNITTLLLFTLPILALGADDKPKSEKKPVETFTDAAKAGPDFAIQGEYVGVGPGQQKFGVQVIADGDGQFRIKGHIGGLPGAGWSGRQEDVKEWKGKLENGKVKFGDQEAQLVIADDKITTAVESPIVFKKITRKSPTEGMKPPEGAVVLFDGTNVDGWTKMDRKSPATWTLLEGNVMQVNGGDILSKQKVANYTLHIEFRLPFMPRARGQGRANSGVYQQNRYELQVLDSFGLKGLNNEAGGFYQASDPKVNMCFPPLQWQTYDVEFTAAKFENEKKVANARATVKHNGVVVQDDVELKGPTPGGEKESAEPDGIRLQDHGNPMQFRNIWVLEKK